RGETQRLEQLRRPTACFTGGRADAERGDFDVLTDGERPERVTVLERSGQAMPAAARRAPAGDVAALQLDGPAARPVEAAQHVHERRLACPVRPDPPDDPS